MKRFIMFMLVALVAVQLGCAAAGGAKSIKSLAQVKKVAVVSLTMSDWGGSVKAGGAGGNVDKTLQNATSQLLKDTEARLGKDYKVVKAETFVGNGGYQKATVKHALSVYTPEIKGKELGVFTADGKSLKRGDVTPEKARELCKLLGVDGVFVIFSEWTVKTGGFVPTTKAVTKNIVSLWDAKGEKVFTRRVDKMGSRVIGGMGIKAVTADTVDEWTGTYRQALDTILM